mgnify:CR=1 FL=1
MGKPTNKLTDLDCRNATPEGYSKRNLSDGGGLTLVVKLSGKTWWLRFRFAQKERTITLGSYPETSLKEARTRRDEMRRLLKEGTDPVMHRRSQEAEQTRASANTFKAVALEWYEEVHSKKAGDTTHKKNLRRLERHAFPHLGRRPLDDIEPPEVLEVLRRIQRKGHVDNAHRLKSLIGQVCRYGVSTGRATRDVTSDLKGVLPPAEVKHHAALVTPDEVAPLLRAVWSYEGTPPVCAAFKLAPMLFLRPGNLRQMRWEEIDWREATWSVDTTKNREPFITPLPTQAFEILAELEALTGNQEWVFPSLHGRGRPMSENAITAGLNRMGFQGEMTGHGFRAMAKTILTEQLGFRVEIIEMQMAHQVRDIHGRAYNRTTWMPERRAMMQAWADYLDELRTGANRSKEGNVIDINRR